jgi:uncharacterized protein DUF7024
MKLTLQISAIVVLVVLHAYVFWAVLHPQVSAEYRAYYIDHSSSDFNAEHYPGTPKAGLIFSREGLPSWVSYTRGLSVREPWGRWTDNNLASKAVVTFTRGITGDACVALTATAVPWLVGKTVPMHLGNEARDVQIAAGDGEYQVQFGGLNDANELALILPSTLPRVSDVAPGSSDTRKLGLMLKTLRILPGSCQRTQN